MHSHVSDTSMMIIIIILYNYIYTLNTVESNYRNGPMGHKKYPYECFVVSSLVHSEAMINTYSACCMFKYNMTQRYLKNYTKK